MIVLANPINVVEAIPNLRRWSVEAFDVKNRKTPPRAYVEIEVKGSNRLYSSYSLEVFDSNPCIGLRVKAVPLSSQDQLELMEISIPNAYTQLVDAYYATSGGIMARLAALEPLCLSLGLLTPSFAGA